MVPWWLPSTGQWPVSHKPRVYKGGQPRGIIIRRWHNTLCSLFQSWDGHVIGHVMVAMVHVPHSNTQRRDKQQQGRQERDAHRDAGKPCLAMDAGCQGWCGIGCSLDAAIDGIAHPITLGHQLMFPQCSGAVGHYKPCNPWTSSEHEQIVGPTCRGSSYYTM